LLGFGFGVGVVPHRVGVDIAVHIQRVVAGLAFPCATGFVVAEGDVLLVERTLGKVVVAFDQDGVVTFGNQGAVPGGFHKFSLNGELSLSIG
jgi:hypothetical protein